jgi:hypothetical protein
MGDAYHGPACPFNLISYRTLMELGFGVQWDRDSIITTSPSGDRLSFEFDNSCGLYVADAVASSPVLVANHFTTEQRKRARMLRELHERLNHASDDQMASLLDLTCLLDTPLTAKDVRISARINGPCNSCLAGKFMNAPSRPSTSTPSSSPGQLLHADIAFFQEGRPYLVVVDDFSGFCFCRKLQSESAAVVGDAVEAVISEYKAWATQWLC